MAACTGGGFQLGDAVCCVVLGGGYASCISNFCGSAEGVVLKADGSVGLGDAGDLAALVVGDASHLAFAVCDSDGAIAAVVLGAGGLVQGIGSLGGLVDPVVA